MHTYWVSCWAYCRDFSLAHVLTIHRVQTKWSLVWTFAFFFYLWDIFHSIGLPVYSTNLTFRTSSLSKLVVLTLQSLESPIIYIWPYMWPFQYFPYYFLNTFCIYPKWWQMGFNMALMMPTAKCLQALKFHGLFMISLTSSNLRNVENMKCNSYVRLHSMKLAILLPNSFWVSSIAFRQTVAARKERNSAHDLFNLA